MAPLASAAVGPPTVKAKGLKSITLRRRVDGWRRLDMGPFYPLYLLAVLKAGMHAGKYEWCAGGGGSL